MAKFLLETERARELSRLTNVLGVLEYKPKSPFDLDFGVFFDQEFSLNSVSLIFVHGNKKLVLDFFDWPDSSFIHAQTKLDRLDKFQKIPKDTTFVYSQAHSAMQQVANYYQRSVMYLFYTTREGLARWADDKSRGASVFDWDAKIVADKFYFLKIIEPAGI